jgi:tape measure domain-containing protein
MASQDQLFWATGIDNTGLEKNKNEAVEIFRKLSTDVSSSLSKMERAYTSLIEKSKFKFTNPVDPGTFETIRAQIANVGKVIDAEIGKFSNLAYQYDKSMEKIKASASKISSLPASNPLAPTVNNIHKSVQQADNDISYLGRIFKRGISYMLVYGSVDWAKNFALQVVRTKGEFDQLRVSIDAFINDAERSKRLFNEITSFAVRSPSQLLDITGATKQLLSYGVQAKDVMKDLQMLSDIAAGSGQKIDDMTYLYGTSMVRGQVYRRELNQFASRGIPIYQALNKELKVNDEQLLKMVEHGMVGFPQLEKALKSLAAPGGIYYGHSDLVAQTTYGKLSNLEDKWKVALDQIGEANDGIINSSVSLTSSLISNWEKVGDTIKGIIAIAGTYKLSQIAVNTAYKGKQTVYAKAYTNVADTAVSPEWREQAAKQGLIRGSIEYQAALEKELQMELKKSTIAVASINLEIERNKKLIEEKEILIADAERNVIAKQAEMDAAIASGGATEIETSQLALNNAQKELNTLEQDKNTASTTLNNMTTELSTAEQTKNTLSNAMDTASTEANTAAKGANAAITGVLSSAWMKLTAFMKANEFALIAAAIAGVIYVLYKAYQSVTNLQSAEEKVADIEKKIDDQRAKQAQTANDLINVIEQETSSIGMKEEALRKLQAVMPEVFKNMKLQNMLTKDGVYWQEKANEVARQKSVSSAKMWYGQSLVNIYQLQKDLANLKNEQTSANMRDDMANLILIQQINKKTDELRIEVETSKKLKKVMDDAISDSNKAEKAAANPVKNKDYWTKKVADLNMQRNALEDSKKGSKEWNKLTAEIDSAQKHLDKYEKPATEERKAEAAKRKAETEKERRERTLSDINSRKQQIAANNKEIIDYEAQAEEMRQEAYADEMEKGYIHDKQVIENEYNKKIQDIEKQKEKILKLSQENEKDIFLNKPVTTRGVFSPTIKTWADVPIESQKGVVEATDAANKIRISKEKSLQNEFLKNYNDYTQQKEEIDRKYSEDKKSLMSIREGYDEGSDQYNSLTKRIAQNEKERVLAQSNLAFKQVKESPTYQLAFDDLNKASLEGLWSLIDLLKKYRQVAVEAYNPEDIKTYSDEINKVFDKLKEKDPFTVISKGKIELAKAKEELALSESELANAQKEYNEAVNNIEMKPLTNEDAVSLPTGISVKQSGGKTSVTGTSKESSTDTEKLANATDKLNSAQQKYVTTSSHVVGVQNEIDGATKTLTGAFGELGSSATKVGDAMGGVVGGIVSVIGTITTTVTSAITGMDAAADSGSKSIQTIEKASVVLMVISTAIQLAEKVASFFSSESSFEKLEKKLTALNKTLDETVTLYKELLDKQAGGEALATGEEEIASIKREIENYQKLADAKMADSKSGIGGHHSIDYNYGNVKDIQNYIDKINEYNEKVREMQDAGEGGTEMSTNLTQNQQDLLTFYNTLKDVYGISIDNIRDLSNLTGEQLETLKIKDPEAWSRLDSTVQDYFDKIIDKANSLQDTLNEIYASATGVDWSDLKNGMDDFLLSTDTTMSDISDNFETYMRKAILNLVKSKYLTSALENWYTEFANDLNDDTLSATEAENLKNEYEKIYTTASGQIQALLDMADVSLGNSTSNSVKSSFQSMSEDQANVLTAQFSAIRINVSDILVSLKDNNNKIDLIAADISMIRKYTSLLQDIKSTISDMYSRGVIVR